MGYLGRIKRWKERRRAKTGTSSIVESPQPNAGKAANNTHGNTSAPSVWSQISGVLKSRTDSRDAEKSERDKAHWMKARDLALEFPDPTKPGSKLLSDVEGRLLKNSDAKDSELRTTVAAVLEEAKDLKRKRDDERYSYTNSHGERIVPREHFDRAIRVFSEYTRIVDIAIQHSPEVTSLVWAGVSFVMKVYLEKQNMEEHIASVMEIIGTSMASAAFYANIYEDGLSAEPDRELGKEFPLFGWREKVELALPQYYASILVFVIKARSYFEGSTGDRIGIVFERSNLYQTIYSIIQEKEGDLKELASMATMKGVKNINESTKQILEIVRSMHTQSQNSEFSKSDILSWLNAVDPTESAEPHQKRRLPGTCEWFFNHETYSAWKDGSDEASKSVIVYGIPGAGKSVLASEIVRRLELERDRGTLTVYFFFRETEISLRTPVEMLASIISQLLKSGCDTERCYDILKQHLIDSSFFARSKEKRRTADNLMMCLLEMLRGFPKRVNLVLDALDECDEPRKIAEFVELRNNYGAFSRKARVPSIIYGNSARILLTGRPVYVVKQSFVSLEEANVLSVIQMDVGDDIKKLIEDTVKDRPELKHVKDMIVQTIHENSDGMFRYAALVLEELLEYSPDPIPIRLKNMPKELAGMYDLILQRLHYRTRGRSQAWDVDMRKRILMWVSMSYIPISIQEMALACVVTEDRLLKPEEVMLPTESMILLCCGSLIEALQSDGNTILRFTHRTVKEFLLRQLDSQPTSNDLSAQYMFTEEEAHAYIALISVKQLSSPSLFNGYKDIFGMPNTTVEDTPEKRSPFHYPLYFGLEHAEIVACYEHQSDTAMRMWTALWEWLDKGDDRFFHWMRHVSTFEGKIRKFWTFVAGSDIFKRADYYGDSGHFANAKLHSQADTHTYHLSTIGGKQERSKRVFILLFLILLDLEPLIILNIETYREYWEMELASKVDRHYLHHGQYFSYAIHHQNLSAAIYFLENGLVSSDAMNTPGFLYGCISDVLRQKSNFALPLVDMVVDSEGLDLNVRNWEGESIMARHLLRGGETLLDLMNAEADHAMSYRWCYSDYDPWEGNCACIRIAEGRGQTILEKPVEGIVFRPGGPLFFDHVTHAGPTHRALCFKVIEKIKQKGGKTRKELGEYLIDSSKYKKVWYNNGVDTVACKLSDIL